MIRALVFLLSDSIKNGGITGSQPIIMIFDHSKAFSFFNFVMINSSLGEQLCMQ